MKCFCIIDSDPDEYSKSEDIKIRKANKEHRCVECDKIIKNKEKYEHTKAFYSDGPSNIKTCLICSEIRNTLFSSWTYGGLWESLSESLLYNDYIPYRCSKLLTKKARDSICDFIESRWDD